MLSYIHVVPTFDTRLWHHTWDVHPTKVLKLCDMESTKTMNEEEHGFIQRGCHMMFQQRTLISYNVHCLLQSWIKTPRHVSRWVCFAHIEVRGCHWNAGMLHWNLTFNMSGRTEIRSNFCGTKLRQSSSAERNPERTSNIARRSVANKVSAVHMYMYSSCTQERRSTCICKWS